MAAPILLVADDLPLISAVKRVLAREGYECVLATSAADALIAWGHGLPGLVILQPSVESGRGALLLEELKRHPDGLLLKVLLLGEVIPGHPWPVEPLPVDPTHLARSVDEAIRASEAPASWELHEAPKAPASDPSLSASELDTWRVTRPPQLDEAVAAPVEAPVEAPAHSETGEHLISTLRSEPSQVWPAGSERSWSQDDEEGPRRRTGPPAPAPTADAGVTTGRQYALPEPEPEPEGSAPSAEETPAPDARASARAERPSQTRVSAPTPLPAATPSAPAADLRLTPVGSEAAPPHPGVTRRTRPPMPPEGVTRGPRQTLVPTKDVPAKDAPSKTGSEAPGASVTRHTRSGPSAILASPELTAPPAGSPEAPEVRVARRTLLPVAAEPPSTGSALSDWTPPRLDDADSAPEAPVPAPPRTAPSQPPVAEWYTPPPPGSSSVATEDAVEPVPLLEHAPEWYTPPPSAPGVVPPGLSRVSPPGGLADALGPVVGPDAPRSAPLTELELEALAPLSSADEEDEHTLGDGDAWDDVPASSPSTEALADELFGDLSSLQEAPPDRDVDAAAGEEALPPTVPPRAIQVLVRAEAMMAEGRAAFSARAAALDEEAARRQAELEQSGRQVEEAEARAEAAQAAKAALEEELLRVRASVELLERAALDATAAQAAALEAARAHAAGQLAQTQEALGAEVTAWRARAEGAEADLRLVRAEVEALAAEGREREERLAELDRQREAKAGELNRDRQERLAELSRQQADAISTLTRRHDEQVAELRYRLSEAQAAAEISKAEAAAVGEVLRQLSEEQTAHAETGQRLVDAESRLLELDASRSALEQRQAETEQALQHAQELASSTQARLDELELAHAETEARLTAERAEWEGQLTAERAEWEGRLTADRTEWEGQLTAERTEWEGRLTAERTELESQLSTQRAELDGQLTAQRVELEAQLAAQRAELEARAAALEADLRGQLERERAEHESERSRQRRALEGDLGARSAEHEAELARQQAAHDAVLGERLAELTQATASVAEARAAQDEAEQARSALEVRLKELHLVVETLKAEQARLTDELERAAARQATLVKEQAQLKDALEGTRARAEGAEASAALAAGKVLELEHRNVMTLALPAHPPLGVSRHGTVDLEGLSRLVSQLVLAQADARLELGVVGGTRSLWLKKGQIVAAASTFEREGLIDRARRDGLIDARQEAELRPLRPATLKEQLEALKARGYIRDVEAVPLVQRCAEQVALAALSEDDSQYRLQDDAPGWDVTQVTIPRATLPLLAEALRRAVPVDALLTRLGGGDAVPVGTDAELELRALGFSDRERRLLAKVDGEATVEALCLASGLKSDHAFRALEVARLLGVIELRPAQRPAVKVDPELDSRRLEAKYDEVVEGDYFSILGLPRTAGADEVQSAWQRLSNEFHPLRFSGHPDPVLQQRAQVVFNLLEEAARALEDDRRRSEYARHLLD